ncbi:hypothetical protein E4U54_003018 [Claviceps lovelessii]|nr:hypothetical protein E4U54_003018 [Claviceps lovelessii]
MEPPVKRRRLRESLEEPDRAEVDDQWEEYDGDDDTESGPIAQARQQQVRCPKQVDGHQPAVEKTCADTRWQTLVSQSREKSGPGSEDTRDETHLTIGDNVLNENMRHEVAVGIPGEEIHHEEQDLSDDDEDGHGHEDTRHQEEDGDGDGDEDEDEEEEGHGHGSDDDGGEEEDGARLKESTDREMSEAGRQNNNGSHDKSTTANHNQSWATDGDDTEVMPDYMQLHGPYPDPDSVDSIPGYNHGLAADEGHGPSLISGLYDGGGLRYASSVGPYGASPFALGPWEMLPQFQEAFGVPNLSGLSPARAADYRCREYPSVRTLTSLTSPQSSEKRPRSMQHAATYSSKDDDGEPTGQSANLFEQHPEEASAYFAEPNHAASSSGVAGRGVHAKSPIRRTKTWHAATTEDSDTVEDPVFSAEDIDASSQTGDDFLPSNQAHEPATSSRVVPAPKDTVLPREDHDAIPAIAATARASYNKPSHQDFDQACMLSDDEMPLFTIPPGATASSSLFKKVARSVAKSSSVGASGVSSDDAAARRRQGPPKKHPRTAGRSRNSDSRLPKGGKSRPVAPTANSSGPGVNTAAWNGSIPPQKTAAANESETESTSRKKRGKPRKSERAQQQGDQQQAHQQQQAQQQQQQQHAQQQHAQQQHAQQQHAQQQHAQQQHAQQQQAHQPFMPYPPQMFGQPYYFPPFQFGFQPQPYYPFQPMMQQPFQPYPAPMAYQPLQSPFFPQPAVQLQHPLLRGPMHPLLQQLPAAQRPLAPAGGNSQPPVKRKRGRPRKYPVGYKRCRRKVQVPNGMTALVGNRLPATEDAWYGVARRLAQDISSLQGGYLFSNGFQMQAQAYEPVRKGPHTQPPQSQYPVESSDSPSDSSSESELEEDDAGRITEVLDNAEEGMSPEPLSGDMSRAGRTGNLEGSESSAGPKDSDDSADSEGPGGPGGPGGLASPGSPASPASFANNDDAGFVDIAESPKSDVRSVGPTPPPPSPPLSARRSSLSMREKHVASTPTPVRTIGSRTSTPTHVRKSRTPASHKSDAFGLPSSPLSTKKRSDMSLIASPEQVMTSEEPVDNQPEPDGGNLVVESAYIEVPDSEQEDSEQEEAVLPVDDDLPTVVQEDTHPQQVDSTAELQPLPPNITTTARSPPAPLTAVESASPATKTPKTPKWEASSVACTPRRLFKPRSPMITANAAEVLETPHPEADGDSLSDVGAAASPSLFISSPAPQVQAAPQTPDKSSLPPVSAVTPRKSPVSRAAMVPRSVERCTPIFVDVKCAPPKLPSITEKRTMGELKQAIIAPRNKIQEAKPRVHGPDLQGTKQLPLKSTLARTGSDNQGGRKEHSRHHLSFPAAEARRSSSLRVQGTKSVVASKPSKAYTPEFDTTKDKKRQKSRHSLLSLVSSRAKGHEVDDDDDELGSPIRSRSKPSSSKSSRSFATGKTAEAADSSAYKIRKSTSRTRQEDQVLHSEREKTKDPNTLTKKKKKRRHTDGIVSKHSGSGASDDAGVVRECGVDGYTCNRDFCFTCL